MSARHLPRLPVTEFAPGDRARANGIYRVLHDAHREPHTVCVLKGDEFPACRHCGDGVRYQLWIPSDYLAQGWKQNAEEPANASEKLKNLISIEAGRQWKPVHSVHIYDDDSALISRLCGIVSSGLRVGDSAVIVATPEHRIQLVTELRSSGVPVRDLAREGRFMMVDAREALSTFMINGMPDPELFACSIGAILEDARRKSQNQRRGLTVYGEMVAVLWEQGNKEGALRLEELWNDVLNQRAFHLHCAYPRSGFVLEGDSDRVCSAHSHVLQ